jgi:hypothetical protein
MDAMIFQELEYIMKGKNFVMGLISRKPDKN